MPRRQKADHQAELVDVAQAEPENLGTARHRLITEAQRLDREIDLYRYAHVHRWSHHPGQWTAEQIDEAARTILPMGPHGPGKARWKGRAEGR